MASYYKGTRNIKKEHYNMGILLTEEKKREILEENFQKRVGYKLNLDNPRSFNEKIMWSKLYYQNPLITRCCDKYAVKDYVAETIGEEYTVKTIATWDDPEEIDFDKLPDRFALKVNWSSGYNIICHNKANLDRKQTIRTLKKWMKPDRNAYYQFFNWGFKHMKPVVYAEEYLEQENGQVYDYKFFVFNGKVKMMFIATDRYGEQTLTHDFFDRDFQHLPFSFGGIRHAEVLPAKPKHYDKMIELAEKLAKPFPFVRVDFYETGDRILLGEMTFYPGGGVLPYDPQEWDYKIGEWYQLPPKMITDRKPPLLALRLPLARLKNVLLDKLRAFKKKIFNHEIRDGKHYVTLAKIFLFGLSAREYQGYQYVSVDTIEVRRRKLFYSAKENDQILPDPVFDVLPPRMAYAMEDKITPEMKKHYCEQKGFKQLHYFPNLDEPRSYNEKILWLALHYKNPHHAVASDKALAKEWIGSRVGYEYVVPLLGAYSNVNDIDFDALPEKFVMKANEGWGADQVILVTDKASCNIDHLKALAASWLYPWSSYYYNNMCITDEKPEQPLVVFEEYLEHEGDGFLEDYKLYCCNGRVKFSLVVSDRGTADQVRTFVDREWNVLPVRRAGKPHGNAVEKPLNIEKMYEIAETLAAEFPFVRIDFYNLNGRLYVGEMTFTPGLFLRLEPRNWDFQLGEQLDISHLLEEYKTNPERFH